MNIKRTNSNALNLVANFGAQASFSSVNDKITFGDNYSQTMIKGLNALNMSLNVSFANLTDQQSEDAISFLQSKFDYEPQNYSTDGHFTNKRLEPIEFQPPFPYKKSNFYCGSFTHEKQSFDVNTVTANLSFAAPSILSSVEPNTEYNPLIESLVQLSFNTPNSNPLVNFSNGQSCSLAAGNLIYDFNDYRTFKVKSPFSVSSGSPASADVENPFDVLGMRNARIQHTDKRHSIFIDKPNDCSFNPNAPKHIDGNLNARIFDFRASKSMPISHSPKVKQSGIIDFYTKFNKYGFNANLNNLQVEFTGRSDLEAKRILLFLESHLGYKKFCFHARSQYQGTKETNSPPSKGKLSFFYCPEWTHTYNYIDNHSITATFIECLSI